MNTSPTKAALLHRPKPVEQSPLSVEEVPIPDIGRRQVLVRVPACGVCRSNLHMIEGDWAAMGVPAKFPIIPGHEIAGRIARFGDDDETVKEGDRVGIQPLWSACGRCEFCLAGREQICQSKQITGETVDGGYAEYGADVIAVSRSNQHITLAKELGASDVVDISRGDEAEWLKRIGPVDSSIVFAPSTELAQLAMRATKPGGTTVIGVWLELGQLPFVEEKRVVQSVIGSRNDMREVLGLASAGKTKPVYEEFKLEMANEVLKMLKAGQIRARAVLVP